jgi:hypothetical protein
MRSALQIVDVTIVKDFEKRRVLHATLSAPGAQIIEVAMPPPTAPPRRAATTGPVFTFIPGQTRIHHQHHRRHPVEPDETFSLCLTNP